MNHLKNNFQKRQNILNNIFMTEKSLYIVFPVQSHYNAFFSLFQDQRHNSQVFVTGTVIYKDIISRNGFNFLNFKYYCKVEINTLSSSFWYFFGLLMNPSRRIKRYKNLLRTAYHVKHIVSTINPDVIYIDAHLSYYTMFIPKKYKIFIVNTKLRSDRQKGIPPLYSSFVSNNSMISNMYCEILWYKHILRYTLLREIKKIAYLRTDEVSLLKAYAKKHSIDFTTHFLKEYNCSFYLEINFFKTGIQTIIVSPTNFDYSWSNLKCIIQRDPSPYTITENINLKLLQFVKSFENHKILNKNLKLIYCAVGTNNKLHVEKVILFFRKILSVCKCCENYSFIISTGGIDIMKESECMLSNILISDYLPQSYVLSICDLFITHGGLNSIRESIFYKKPMLVYPIDVRFDQPGNAARVVHNKIGLKGAISRDSPTDIINKINYIFNLN